MKRADITKIFPEASKEAIDELLSINGADVNAVKSELETLRQQLTDKGVEDLQKAQKQIDALSKELDSMKAAEAVRQVRTKVAGEKKVPVDLLTGETEEACAKQADAILAFAKPGGYPNIPDGGEVHHPPSNSTRDKFAAYMSDKI